MTMNKTLRRTLRPGLIAVAATAAMLCTGLAHAQFQERNVRISMTASKDNPSGVALTKTSECLAAKSGGKFKMRPFFEAVLGPEHANLTQVRSGSLDGALITTAATSLAVPQLGVFDLPFLVSDYKEIDALLDGPFGTRLAGFYGAAGLEHLAFWEHGFRNVTNSRRPIHKLEDLQGLKLRVIQNKTFIDAFTQLGANPVPMPYTEVYSALETKAIDGQENPVAFLQTSKLYEVQKHVAITRHVYSPTNFIYSKTQYDKLTADEQKALRDCAMENRLVNRQLGREMEVQATAFLKAQGVTISEPSKAELERMREKTKSVYTNQAAVLGSELINALNAEVQKIRMP
jgi:tripartite ATP-independent transporter DctP family solute receptor